VSVLAQRLAAQRLSGPPATSVVEIVQHLLAVQGQDPRGARLAIRARTSGLTAADVDDALNVERSVLITTLNRGTLHLVTAEDYWLLHPLTTPQLLTGSNRRLAQEQVPAAMRERGVAIIEKTLARDGPTTRDALREALATGGVRTEGQAFIHLIYLASMRGLIVRGPLVGKDHAFVLVRDWLGKPPKPLARETALGELARRYLAAHAPADPPDPAKWAGITLGEARLGFAALSPPPYRVEAVLPPPRLLGAFDPSLLGWASRKQIIGTTEGIVTSNGIFRPFAMVQGHSVATWTLTRSTVTLAPIAPISTASRAALDGDAGRVLDFLGR
jgi:Winged helix DNA-binding domain